MAEGRPEALGGRAPRGSEPGLRKEPTSAAGAMRSQSNSSETAHVGSTTAVAGPRIRPSAPRGHSPRGLWCSTRPHRWRLHRRPCRRPGSGRARRAPRWARCIIDNVAIGASNRASAWCRIDAGGGSLHCSGSGIGLAPYMMGCDGSRGGTEDRGGGRVRSVEFGGRRSSARGFGTACEVATWAKRRF
jgi:hypothetical protein